MEVDVLIVMENGIATETHVVEAEATAEATFEDLVKKMVTKLFYFYYINT